jgi:hypothetical protein
MATAQLQFSEDGHRYTADGEDIPSVTQILAATGLVDHRGIPAHILNRKAELGTAVHLACRFYDENDLDPDSLDPKVAPYVAAWRKFVIERGFQITEIEKQYLGEIGGLKFGMTLDRRGRINGTAHDFIVDLKCSNKVERWHSIQMAGYAIGVEASGTASKRLQMHERMVVQLRPDATYHTEIFNDHKDGEIFVSALEIATWKLKFNDLL